MPTSKVPATLGEVDVVFPVLHGPFGEDGTVQGLLELAGVPYVGAGVLGSALAMDKDVFKAVMRDRGVPVTRNITLRAGRQARRTRSATRPSSSRPGSAPRSASRRCTTTTSSRAAVALAFEHDEKVLVEEFVDGVEVECGVLGNEQPEASLPGEIVVARLRGRRLVRLLGQVRRGRDGPDRPAAARAGDDRARPGAGGAGLRRRRVRGHGPGRLLRRAPTARCSSTS